MRSDYHERKQARIERYQELAAKNEQESNQAYKNAKSLGDQIPMGQPILVGHHSEGYHRRHLDKIDNNMRKSVEANKKAAYYADKAESVEKNNAISSDNPDALELLKAKLSKLERHQEFMKATNKLYKAYKKNPKAIEAEGLSANMVEIVKTWTPKYTFETAPYQTWALSNNNANMKNVRDRIEQLEKLAALPENDLEINGIRILSSKDTNRVQIFFDGKPAEAVRTELKANGFRWAPREEAWQRQLSEYAEKVAIRIVTKYYTETVGGSN